MADDTPPNKPGPLASLIQEAQNSNLTVRFSPDVVVNADEFAYIERDCQAFKDEIQRLQGFATQISRREKWGLGEDNEKLALAKALVTWFRGKAASGVSGDIDSANNAWDILQQHYDIIDDIQKLHHTIAQKYVEQDAAFAAEYKKLTANMPKSPIGQSIPATATPELGKSWQ